MTTNESNEFIEQHDPNLKFWFNTKTKEVELGPQSLGFNRIGPFDTRAEAEGALDTVNERARQLREEDEREDD